ncbi:MAG TPA: hypothetical protein VMZ50_12870 [Phycisphaerae bacterium]|nr:hypothetical protein [Phycisphaerae bacterium]
MSDERHEFLTKEMRFTLDRLMCEYRRDDINLRVSQEAVSHMDLAEVREVVGGRVRQLEALGQ